ncbi:sensor protein Chase2 [Calothrix sp. HK-06]|nr:sensor protein Chase2 [Calothrix sp. HK-06]
MEKLVILKLGSGSFEQGFPVTLQIGEEAARPMLEITGDLPPGLEVVQDYQQWQTIYYSMDLRGRPIGVRKPTRKVATVAECQKAADQLRVRFNQWLQAESFRPIREKWLEKLQPDHRIRVIIQTKDYQVQKLPWHVWDLVERYSQAEIALAAPTYEQIPAIRHNSTTVRILAILGNSQNIDTQADRMALEQLTNARVNFLVEPRSEDLSDRLWEQPWDILFFAGHSYSDPTGETGLMSINPNESLTISQLKYALSKAVGRGLKLAIFNSCNGLGLAREFASLQIPQLIVMREPVPDRVAQTFLKYFLEAFSRGESLYLAVREARERLQGLETQFPCASWLPVIFQNPAEIPSSWNGLLENTHDALTNTINPSPPKLQPQARLKAPALLTSLTFASLISIGISALVLGVRHLGFLQSWELQAFDHLRQYQPDEPPDSRILIVTVTEADVQAQPQEQRRGSLSDLALAKLLDKLEAYQPRVIGLDIYRDYPVQDKGQDKELLQKLAKWMHHDRFIAVCQVSNPITKERGIAPPEEVSSNRLGFSDLALDPDNVVRRHLLALDPPPDSSCPATYALSTQLAIHYLAKQGIELKFTDDGKWKLGKTVFKPLEAHTGGYQDIDAWGHQILLNYRSHRSITEIAPQITLGEVLAGKLNAEAVKDRIVLIGTTAASFKDFSLTPYKTDQGEAQSISGVILQAQAISQIISAALDGRPLLWVLPYWGEGIWILLWAIVGSLLGLLRQPKFCGLTAIVTIITIYISCLGLLIGFGCWIPFIPPVLALLGSGGSTFIVIKLLVRNKKND